MGRVGKQGTAVSNVRIGDRDLAARPRLWLVPAAEDAAVSEATLDATLMRRLREGDSAAFARLYDRYAPRVHGIARAILRDDQLAEEATHDVFLVLWQRPGAFDPVRGTFAAWLLRSARNRSIDLLRHRRWEQPLSGAPQDDGDSDSDLIAWLVDPGPDPADQAVARVVGGKVRTALAWLSPDHRRLLEMAYFKGLTQREIAEQLGRPLGTVKTQIRTAMQRLADRLDEFAPVPRNAAGDEPR